MLNITVNLEIFPRVLDPQNFSVFAKTKPLQNDKINLSFTAEGKTCSNNEFLALQILLTPFGKIKC